MRFRKAFFAIVFLECLAIAGLVVFLWVHPRFSFSFSLVPKGSVKTGVSDRLPHYYEYTGVDSLFIPDWLPYKPVYVVNSAGLNSTENYTFDKPADTFRIVTLGDSWTFGYHVSTADNYSERLQAFLNDGVASGKLSCGAIRRFDVINLGVGGYDLDYEVESLRLRGMAYHPDLVIPLVKYDDLVFVNELWQPRIAELQAAYGNLEAKEVNGVVVNPHQDIAKEVQDELMQAGKEEDYEAYELKELNFLDTFFHGPLLFFVYGVVDRQLAEITSYVAKRGNAYLFLPATLTKAEKVPNDEHPGVLGHARFAQGLYDQLLVDKLIPCTRVPR